jgi:dCMP deaminase
MRLLLQSKPMSKWDQRFCDLAQFVSQWSKDPNAKVGAVVFSRRGGDITVGYNGFPMGVEDSEERLTDKTRKLDMIVHAEVNALIAAGIRAQGSTLYVWGRPVCARCAGSIIQSGVRRVVALSPEFDHAGSWRESGNIALEMFQEAGIQVDLYFPEEEQPASVSKRRSRAKSVPASRLKPKH